MISNRPPWLLVLLLASGSPPARAADDAVRWHDALELGVEGRGWADTKAPYDRLPARAEATVRAPVWELAQHSSGLAVGFVTDAPTISVRWTLRRDRLDMNHMPSTGVSGVDLYTRLDGRWHFLAVGRPDRFPINEAVLIRGLRPVESEYRLYLPLYNGVDRLEIGIPEGASIRPAPARGQGARPVVFYGTSITQGGCASRPGMSYPAILGRRLDLPIVNLGFSGNGKAEPEMAALLAELRPAALVVDCLPNLQPEEVTERLPGLLEAIRRANPDVPILVVEDLDYPGSGFLEPASRRHPGSNERLARIVVGRPDLADGRLVVVPARDLIGLDGEATVDGVHPTDLGFVRMADTIEPFLRKALE